ncbi:MAG TPA: hypothetical protein VK932_27660 [Kofleriaceae bacterium]|nr:hypothetical protein [Kofleriaceae bacterium]
MTSHDGFTFHDLVSYERKRNWANGHGNADGPAESWSSNCGWEVTRLQGARSSRTVAPMSNLPAPSAWRSRRRLGTPHAGDHGMRRNQESGSSEEQRAMREVSTRLPHHHVVDIDPEDPTQQLDDLGEFHIEPLAVEAQSGVEASEDFDIASAENLEGESEPEDEAAAEPYAEAGHDTGELYGVRTPHAGDTDLSAPEDRDSFEGSWRGETWLEAPARHAACW